MFKCTSLMIIPKYTFDKDMREGLVPFRIDICVSANDCT